MREAIRMRVEQLCRFRTDTVGYEVFAKSEGITSANVANHAKFFTQGMDPLFRNGGALETGRSIMTYTGTGDDFFIGMSTMRTDIEGRTSIFHHTYLIKRSEYAALMASNPAAALSIDAAGMYTSEQDVDYTANSAVELDLSNTKAFDEAALREKYGLKDNDKFANLLIGAYRGVTSGRSLKLSTAQALESRDLDAIRIVREIAYLVAICMPPAMRGRITLSSAIDAKTTICIAVPNGGSPVGSPAYEFNLDTGTLSLRSISPDIKEVFRMIAAATPAERADYFAKIEQSGSFIVPVEAINYELFLALHFMNSGKIDGNEMNILNFIDAADSRLESVIKLDGYYQIVSMLVDRMNRKHSSVDQFSKTLVRHYLVGQTDGVQYPHEDAFDRCLIESVSGFSPESVENALQMVLANENVAPFVELIHALISRMDPNSAFFGSKSAYNLVRSVLQNDITALLNDSYDIVCRYDASNAASLVRDVLDDAQSRSFNRCEVSMLNNLISTLIEGNFLLNDNYCSMLDEHYRDYDAPLEETCVSYMMLVRLSDNQPLMPRLEKLMNIRRTKPGFFALIEKSMQSPEYKSELWENYKTVTCFEEGRLYQYDEIARICYENNTFKNPSGAFESKVRELWVDKFNKDLADTKTMSEAWHYAITRSWNAMKKLNWSAQTEEDIQTDELELFWRRASLDEIVLGSENLRLSKELIAATRTEKSRVKAELFFLCRGVEQNPRETSDICTAVLNKKRLFTEEEFIKIKDALYELSIEIVKHNRRFVCWDLLLLSVLATDNKGDFYACDMLLDDISKTAEFAGADKANTEFSTIIAGDEQVKKDLYRAASKYKGALFASVEEELKPEKGFLSKLFGGKKDGKRNGQ